MQESWRVTNEMLGMLTGEAEGAKKAPAAWIRELRCEEEIAKRRWLTKQAKMRQAEADADEQLRPAAFYKHKCSLGGCVDRIVLCLGDKKQ